MSAARLFREGDVDPAVRDIRDRLAATGDLPAEAGPQSPEALDVFDHQLRDAVRAFQQRRGLLVDGIVGPQTYRAMDGARWALGDRILVHLPGHLLSGDDVA